MDGEWRGIAEWACTRRTANKRKISRDTRGASGAGVGCGNNNEHPKSGVIPGYTEHRLDRERSKGECGRTGRIYRQDQREVHEASGRVEIGEMRMDTRKKNGCVRASSKRRKRGCGGWQHAIEPAKTGRLDSATGAGGKQAECAGANNEQARARRLQLQARKSHCMRVRWARAQHAAGQRAVAVALERQ